MSLRVVPEGLLVDCDGCTKTMEHYDDETGQGYQSLVDPDDSTGWFAATGWERWEDGKDRCPDCIDEALEAVASTDKDQS